MDVGATLRAKVKVVEPTAPLGARRARWGTGRDTGLGGGRGPGAGAHGYETRERREAAG